VNLSFHKLVGAGNDFIFVNDSDFPETAQRAELAKKICNRKFGIGADGLVFMAPIDKGLALLKWDFYNNDGSRAEMCGNAARCAVRYLNLMFGVESCQFETLAGLVTGRLEEANVRVQWDIKNTSLEKIDLTISANKNISGYFINTGVPHFVIINSEQPLLENDCLLIQGHAYFGKEQTNVTLLESKPDGSNKTKTFERGVREFTLACGTGVIASAFVLQKMNPLEIYNLEVPGGKLQVQLEGKTAHLIGPAEMVFKGSLLTNEVNHV